MKIIVAKQTYKSKNSEYEVWEVSESDHVKLCNINDNDWKDNWGWWRSSEGSNMDEELVECFINNKKITAWCKESSIENLQEYYGNKTITEKDLIKERKYSNLLGYFCDEIRVSTERNVCAVAVDLAEINNMKMSELFSKYQG